MQNLVESLEELKSIPAGTMVTDREGARAEVQEDGSLIFQYDEPGAEPWIPHLMCRVFLPLKLEIPGPVPALEVV
ncbi:Hypothetical protein MONT_47 [Glutamicibacter phage Montesquieu]|nr:Hypothetical protein MONT_47 [Glutamicibacter phage Montesquieu]